ncbi:MAG: cell division protein ZapA [Bacteroidales bacterium]|jgi:cell division protein ZapA (FtsZ GTPase activity inhibitor)|nr:cell division protein ZapA [Bacteroidales bacterium]
MEQSITIRIAGQDYPLKAKTPEMEELMRTAAENINQKLAAYDAKIRGRSLSDKLTFVSLNETVARLQLEKKLKDLEEKVSVLHRVTESYLDKTEK